MKNHIPKYDSQKISYIQNLIIYFLIFAFIGWILETIYSFIVLGHFTKRGFLYGPLCPIYGYSAVIMLTSVSKYKDNYLKLFFYSIILFSGFEYVAGFLLDAIFSIRLWDYTKDFLNLNGRISIFYSIAWGIIAILFVNYMSPFVENKIKYLIEKIPSIFRTIVIYIFSGIYLIDTFFSFFKWI